MPKITAPLPSAPRRHKPLSDDLVATGPLRTKSNKRKARRDDDGGDGFVDSRASRKILKIGQDLAEEEQKESKITPPSTAFTFESRFDQSSESDGDGQLQEEDPWHDEGEDIVEEVVGMLPTLTVYPT